VFQIYADLWTAVGSHNILSRGPGEGGGRKLEGVDEMWRFYNLLQETDPVWT